MRSIQESKLFYICILLSILFAACFTGCEVSKETQNQRLPSNSEDFTYNSWKDFAADSKLNNETYINLTESILDSGIKLDQPRNGKVNGSNIQQAVSTITNPDLFIDPQTLINKCKESFEINSKGEKVFQVYPSYPSSVKKRYDYIESSKFKDVLFCSDNCSNVKIKSNGLREITWGGVYLNPDEKRPDRCLRKNKSGRVISFKKTDSKGERCLKPCTSPKAKCPSNRTNSLAYVVMSDIYRDRCGNHYRGFWEISFIASDENQGHLAGLGRPTVNNGVCPGYYLDTYSVPTKEFITFLPVTAKDLDFINKAIDKAVSFPEKFKKPDSSYTGKERTLKTLSLNRKLKGIVLSGGYTFDEDNLIFNLDPDMETLLGDTGAPGRNAFCYYD